VLLIFCVVVGWSPLKLIQGDGEMARTGILVASTNRGRYKLDHAGGVDVTAGTRLIVLLASHWIAGTVEHGLVYSGESGIERGYYFIADSGKCCGLCLGMQVQDY
jgi:hypothetical protein